MYREKEINPFKTKAKAAYPLMRARHLHRGYLILCMVCYLFWGLLASAQNVQVAAHLDSNTILIGEQVHLHLTAFYNLHKGLIKIEWPAIGDSVASKIKVVSKSKIDTVLGDSSHPEQQLQKQDILITCFDSGYYAIPPFRFIVNGDTAHPLITEPMMLTVHTVVVDTTKGIKDIKGPISAPWSIFEILPWIGIGVVVLAIILIIIYYVRKKMKNKTIAPVIIKAPPIEPHVKALKALQDLADRKLWQEGRIKEYHTAISDILRTYIGERYSIAAPEMITSEIMQALRRTEVVNTPFYMSLQQILILSDLVKFAKEKPLAAEHEKSLSDAIDFIKETIPKQEQVQPAANESVQNGGNNNQPSVNNTNGIF